LFTRNIYKDYLRAEAGDRELLWMGRLSGLGLTVLGILFALWVDEILQAFLFTETIAALMGVMFLGGLLWRRANRHGALAATLAAFVVYYGLNCLATTRTAAGPTTGPLGEACAGLLNAWHSGNVAEFLAARQLRLVYTWTAAPFAWAMLAGFASLVVVSLLTRPEDPERIARFFDNMVRTTDGERLPESGEKPLAADYGQDLLMIDLPGWLTRERWRGFFGRYREDLIGFVLGWATVGLLIVAAWAVMQIGR
jgi:Na+/proline symporter